MAAPEVDIRHMRDHPVFDAWVCCLEAVTSVSRALEAVTAARTVTASDSSTNGGGGSGDTSGSTPTATGLPLSVLDELRTAMSATRAATASIKFSLVEEADLARPAGIGADRARHA